MTKAIILTYAKVESEKEYELLKNTKIFKLAINQHAEEYNPDVRICGDWNLAWLCRNFSQPIISIRDKFKFISPRAIFNTLTFKGATIIGAVEWLISKGYNDILIVGDNTVNTKEFQDNVNKHITPLMAYSRIYGYNNGNFCLPTKSITDFIEEKE